MRTLAIVTTLIATMLAGCANTRGANYSPIVDMKDVNYVTYNVDLSECREYAAKVDPRSRALAGAILGAALGAALAPRGFRNDTAGYGAGVGAMSGGAQGINSQENIIRRCLAGRGYNVLSMNIPVVSGG